VQAERISTPSNATSLVSQLSGLVTWAHESVSRTAGALYNRATPTLHMGVVEVPDQRSAEPTPPVERDFNNLPRMLMEEDKSWRCDLHPAWNRDFSAVTINARPTGGDRQVVLLTLGSDLSVYFQ
jgi:hypothetical protein